MDYPKDIHWRMIVANLRASGMSYIDIATRTGFSNKELAEMESEVYYPPYISIMKLLDRINREGTTVVMATHDAGIVDQMRKRVIELEGGNVIRDQARGVYGYTG